VDTIVVRNKEVHKKNVTCFDWSSECEKLTILYELKKIKKITAVGVL